METPRVTVLMSVYNGASYLEEAVESILAQSFRDFELLLIDDCSSDESRAIAERFVDSRIRIVANDRNLGLTKSLNRGLALARGELIARHDADDRSHPERLARQVAFLDANPGVALVGGQLRTIDATGAATGAIARPVTADGIAWELMVGSPFAHGAVLFRRSIVRDGLGGYDETFVTSQDIELWSRLAERWPVANLAETVLDFRIHAQSVSSLRYDVANVLRIEQVLSRNLAHYLGDAGAVQQWPHVWNMIVARTVLEATEEVTLAGRLLDAIHAAFIARRPAAARNAEVRRSRARVEATIAVYLAERHRGAGLARWIRLLFRNPAAAMRALPRFIAVFVAGRRAYAARARLRGTLVMAGSKGPRK